MRVSLVVVCLAALELSAAGGGPRTVKAAWEWDVDERIAARLAPTSPARRTAEEGSLVRAPGTRYFDVDGATDPALLLPHELFSAIVDMPDEAIVRSRRREYDGAIRQAGWNPDEFWQQLGEITKQYLAVQLATYRAYERAQTVTPPKRRQIEAQAERLDVEQCRLRIEALNAARERFGPAFDRFLYTAVAPNISIGSSEPGPGEAGRLARIAGGCR